MPASKNARSENLDRIGPHSDCPPLPLYLPLPGNPLSPLKVGTGYINVEGAEVEEGGNVAVNSWEGTTVYVNVSGQAGDRCLIRVRAYNSGTVPARLAPAKV